MRIPVVPLPSDLSAGTLVSPSARQRTLWLVVAAFVCFSSPLLAAPPDGIHLSANKGTPQSDVALTWDTGPYNFSVYRSTNPATVLDPPNNLGGTTNHAWTDSPPSGAIFFYTVTSSCAYRPPEICNGADDDCDGTIDGPGSESSCSLPNASPQCVNGSCAIAACALGFGDCNGSAADGCETNTHVAQSTSPATIWANDPDPNKDLKPGYARVTGISNCGGCGVTCDDGVGCTTDLCVPIGPLGSTVGVCRRFDRGQCSEARCGGLNLPPGTPPPGDPGCTAQDSDGDGLNDPWETAQTNSYTGALEPVGVDLDCDGEISNSDNDLTWHEPPSGPSTPDIYVQYDYMAASAVPGQEEAESHAPLPPAVDAVRAAFTGHGVTLHIDPVHHVVPHFSVVYFPSIPPDPCAAADAVSFYALKGDNFDPRRLIGYHYFVFAHDSCYAGAPGSRASGLAEIVGNDAMVTLGGFTYAGTPAEVLEKKTLEEAGTLLHELGHNLGLHHGGAEGGCVPAPCPGIDVNQKPNYISSMNWLYQLGGIHRAETPGTIVPLDPTLPWRVDYSSDVLSTLNEPDLNEISGLGGAPPPRDRDITRYYCSSAGPYFGPGRGPVDWNCDAVFSPTAFADVNDDGEITSLSGRDDWANLVFRFQCSPTFADGAPAPADVTPAELTLAQATAKNLRATIICQSNTACDDGNFCNGAETCSPATGACQPGTPPSCDDFNPCTVDACSQAGNGCLHDAAAANGTSCSGPEFCVVGTTCMNGVCGGGTPRNCDDGLACTAEVCNETLRACVTSCTTAPCWSSPVGGGVASAPSSDTAFTPPGAPSSSYVIKGNTLYAFRNTGDATNPPGSLRWTWTPPTGATLDNFPNPVPLSPGAGGGMFIFVGAEDGWLYKIRTTDGVAPTSVDLRRAGCAADTLTATPAVQLYRFSNPAFKNEVDSHPGHAGDDVVFVTTHDGCGDVTANRIFALWSSDLSIKQVFNDPATHWMDFGTEGCTIDYDTNRIYCGTNQPAGRNQNTLWALDGTNFLVVWSDNVGSIQNRPMLANARLYVGNLNGAIMAYDPAGNGAGGARRLWSAPAVVPSGIVRSPWVEFRPGGYQGTILALDTTGTLTRFTDTGGNATKGWSITAGPGATFTSMATVDPTRGKAYIGRSDGFLQQVDLSTGASGVLVVAGASGGTLVFDPAPDILGGADAFNRLTVAAGDATGMLAQFCAPFPTGSCASDLDCTAWNGPCVEGACDLAHGGSCFSRPKADGTSCDDGKACSLGDGCRSGVCNAVDYSNCPCVNAGDAACGPGFTCCGGGTCASLQTDAGHCGACGVVCPPDRTCTEGACVAAPAACLAPTATTLSNAASLLAGGDALAFDRVGAGVCSAYVSSYRYPAPSTVQRIDAAGVVTTMTSPSADAAPLNGIAVPREGNQVFATMVNRPPLQFPPTAPGLIEGTFVPPRLAVARTTLATTSTVPFAASMYDQGPVGPALDYVTYTSSAGDNRLYVGNLSANGDVYELRRTCPVCPWNLTPVPVAITPPGDRITAIAFAPGTNPGPLQHRFLYVGHGATLSIVDLDDGTQSNVNLGTGVPPPAVTGILSIAVHPVYADVYVEVKDSAANTWIVVIDDDDHSIHKLRDVELDFHLQPLVPSTFSNEGRLAFTPRLELMRIVPPSLPSAPPTFAAYPADR